MKKIYFLLVIIPVISCTHRPEQVSKNVGNNAALVKEYFTHFNRHDWDKMADMYSEVSEFKDPSLGPGIVPQTREQIIQKYTELGQIFPDVHDQIVQTYTAGENQVIVEFISTGTAPDSSTFELPICTIFTFENGKIVKDYTYYDNFEG